MAIAAWLKKMKPDKTPRTYDQKAFRLDGRMDLDVTFKNVTMRTLVYIKMDAHDQLLLSEGVCWQLGILSYHNKVEKWRKGSQQRTSSQAVQSNAKVPTVKVKLLRTVRLLPHQCVAAAVEVDQLGIARGVPLLLEIAGDGMLQSEDMLIEPSVNGRAHLLLSNPSGCSHVVTKETCLGEAVKILEESECGNLEAQDFEDDRIYPNFTSP